MGYREWKTPQPLSEPMSLRGAVRTIEMEIEDSPPQYGDAHGHILLEAVNTVLDAVRPMLPAEEPVNLWCTYWVDALSPPRRDGRPHYQMQPHPNWHEADTHATALRARGHACIQVSGPHSFYRPA